MAEINDYLNSLNEAMAIHAQNAIKSLQFNKTELCTIVNETRAEQNIYIVSNGSTKYEVYSTGDIKYHINDRVYVNIPNNDFSQKKYIIGPYVENDAENLLYTSKFANITESETNLAELATSTAELSEDQFEYGVYKFSVGEELKEIELLVPESEIEGLNKGYKYLAISADIKTDFENIPIKMGDYGIKVIITYEKKQETLKEVIEYTKVYALENRDMIGDVYNFRTYFNQKWLYELEKDGAVIKGIKIILYVGNNFKTYNNEQYISSDEKFINIYIANLSIRLSDPSAKSADVIEIYTNNGETYDSRSNTSQNAKEIHLKWQDYDDENEITYNYNEEDKAKNVKIHWYTDKVHSVGEDTIFLTNDIWEEYKENSTKENFNKVVEYYKLEKDRHYTENNITVAGERWIETQVRLGENNSQISDTLAGVGWSLIEGDNFKKWSITFNPDITKNNCKVKAIITDENDEIIGQSNELEFKNTIQVADPATVAKVAGLKIKFTDNSKGNYPIYSGNTGEILSKSEINKTRKLQLELNDPINGNSYFTGNETTIWKIPKNLSMIYILENFYQGKTLCTNKENLKKKIDTLDDITELLNDFDNYYYIVEEKNQKEPEQQYGLNNFYNKLNVNNTIFCYVVKNKVLYSANVSLTFSQYGTSGSEYTFYLGLGNTIINGKEGAPKSIIAFNNTNIRYKIDAKLFNTAGDILDDVKILISWYKEPTSSALKLSEDGKEIFVSKKDDNWDHYKGAVIKASVDYGKIKFTQLLPIHVGVSDIVDYYDGPDKIIYDDTGRSPTKYSKALSLYKNNNKKTGITFKLNDTYQASIDENYLIPANIYYSDNKQPYIITAKSGEDIVFSCPLLILQNKYQIPIVNEWDGSLKVDDKTNSILAASVIAGTKASDGTFTGLLMGQINKPNSIPSIDTGLFGYQGGIQTFRLGTDGQLTLGASGMGQITFNGTSGIIKGSNLTIDLTNNEIIAEGDALIKSTGKIDIEGTLGSKIRFQKPSSNNYIEIGLGNNGPYIDSNLFKLGKDGQNTIGGVSISSSGLFGNGWGISPTSGFYTTQGYKNTVYTDDLNKYQETIDKADLIDYIEDRINVGKKIASAKSFKINELIAPVGAIPTESGNTPKDVITEGTEKYWIAQTIDTMDPFTFECQFPGSSGRLSYKLTLKQYIWWCINKWIIANGGTGLDGSGGVGVGDNSGKHLFRYNEETGQDIIESQDDIDWEVVDNWKTSNEHNTYSSSMYGDNKPWKNCTWAAWELFLYFSGHELPIWGNAVEWYDKAKNDSKYEVSPKGITNSSVIGKLPAVAVYGSTANLWGHVAVIIKTYENGNVDSVEGNYGTPNPYFRLLINGNVMQGRGEDKYFVGYIWLKDNLSSNNGEEGE